MGCLAERHRHHRESRPRHRLQYDSQARDHNRAGQRQGRSKSQTSLERDNPRKIFCWIRVLRSTITCRLLSDSPFSGINVKADSTMPSRTGRHPEAEREERQSARAISRPSDATLLKRASLPAGDRVKSTTTSARQRQRLPVALQSS